MKAAANGNLLGYEKYVGAYEQNVIWRLLPFWLPLTMLFAGPSLAVIIFITPYLKANWAWALWIAGLLMYTIFIFLWARFFFAPFTASGHDPQQTEVDLIS